MDNNERIKLLIIDDNPTVLNTLYDILRPQNFKVLVAKNGETGFQRAISGNPDFVLLDIMLPDIDGFQTCKRLKMDERTKHIPVIFISALSNDNDIVKAFESGAVDYITKPIYEGELLARIRTHLALNKNQK